jgi:hypothetical protein
MNASLNGVLARAGERSRKKNTAKMDDNCRQERCNSELEMGEEEESFMWSLEKSSGRTAPGGFDYRRRRKHSTGIALALSFICTSTSRSPTRNESFFWPWGDPAVKKVSAPDYPIHVFALMHGNSRSRLRLQQGGPISYPLQRLVLLNLWNLQRSHWLFGMLSTVTPP